VEQLLKISRSVLLACTAVAALGFFSAIDATAATITSAQTGNWNVTTTWVGGVVPTAADNAIIAAGHTVTLAANTTITSLTVDSSGVLSTATRTLGVSGNLVVNGTLSGTGAITLSGAGTSIDGTGSITNTAQLTISAAHTILATADLSFSGTIRVQGAITVTNNGTVTTAAAGGITGSVAGATWTQGTTGVLNIAGPLLATGTLTASANGNTINYNGAAQTVKATPTYHHLLLGGSGAKTLTATTTAINGNLTLSGTATTTTVVALTITGNLSVGTGTTFTAAAFALTITGGTSVTGTLTISSATGAKAFNGDVTVNSGGIWNNTAANAALTLPGNISNSGTFNAGTGVHTLSGSSKTISGTFSIPRVTVSGTYQNDGSLTVTTALAGAGTLTNGASGTLNINFTGAVGLTNLSATAVGNTVNYGFAGVQTIKATTYDQLILSNTGAKTAGGALTVNGDFTISGVATFAGGTSLTHTFLGNWIVNTTAATPFSFLTSSTLNFNTPGTPAATSISGTSAATLVFNSVNLNNTSGFSSAENFSVSGILTLAANVTFTPSASVVVSGTGQLTGNGTAKVTRTAATPDFNSQYSVSTKTLTNLTVDYDATAAQTVNALNYFNLTISGNRGGAAVTLGAGSVGVSGTFAPNASNVSYTIAGNTIDYNGTVAQSVIAFSYNNLTSSSTGARTLANSGTIGIAGTFTPGTNSYTITGSTIDFNGSGAQTIPAFNYNHLTSSSTGARTLANSGTIGVAGTFTPGINSYTITGSTIDFNGPGAQTIPSFNYNHLTSSSTGARTLANSGTIGVAGTFSPGTNSYTITGSTIDFNGSGAQTIPSFNYNHLTSSSTGARTLANSGTIGVAGTFTPGTNSYTITGSTIDFNGSGAQTIPSFNYNHLTSSSAGARTLANSGTIGIAGTFTPGSNSYTITGSTVDFNGVGAQTIAAFNYDHLTISNSRTSNNVTLAGSGTIGLAGTLTASATFNAGNGFITAGSTVDYNGTGSQSVTALAPLVAGNSTYDNLTISNTAATVTAGTSFSAGGNFTIGANATFAPGSTVVLSGSGTLTGNGTAQVIRATGISDFANQYTLTNKTLTNLTVEFAGAATQDIGADAFGAVRISNASGITLSGSVTINGTLALASGNITTGANKVIISSSGSVSRTSGHIVGNLQKNVATGATSSTFEIGDAGNYTPVDVSFSSVTVAGDLTASTTSSDHPSIATSTINPAKTVNRYWTLTNNGITFTNYSATFTFIASDLDSGVNTNAVVVGKFSSATWSYPTVGTRTATSTQATGVTSFSEFQLGEGGAPNLDLVKAVSPLGDQEPDTDLDYVVTFTNSGTISAHSVVITDPNPNNADPLQRVFANVDYKIGSASISAPWTATIEFSSDGGATWSYVPVTGAGGAPSGYDRLVTNIRWTITGVVPSGDSGSVSFTTRIR
jgi:hypothetical protein